MNGGTTLHADRLRDVVQSEQTLLVDVWGVIFDGKAALSHAVASLRDIRDAGRTVVLVSNTSRRAGELAALLAGKGIDASLYAGIITAGELAFQALRTADGRLVHLGRRCLRVGEQTGSNWLGEAGLHVVDALEDAELIVAVGLADKFLAAETRLQLLPRAAAAGLPMVLTNPDRRVRLGSHDHDAAGAIADRYVSLGGTVHEFGKPAPEIFYTALDAVGGHPSASVAIGDSVATDIIGAQSAGIRAIWVCGSPATAAPPANDSDLLGVPHAVIPSFVW